MLDWCRNLHINQERQSELIYTIDSSPNPPRSCRQLHPQKYSQLQTTSIQRQNSQSRKGIKTHFNQSLKHHRHTQTTLEIVQRKEMMSSATQTSEINNFKLAIKQQENFTFPPRNNSSTFTFQNNWNQFPNQHFKSDLFNTLTKTKRKSIDYQKDNYRETKASFELIESQEPIPLSDRPTELGWKITESVHIPQTARNHQIPPKPVQPHYSRFQTLSKNRLPHKLYTFQLPQKLSDSVKHPMNSQNSFSEKYKIMLKNVEGEFKHSEKKQSQRKYKYTPTRRILFHDKDTVISKYNDSYRSSQRSVPIEESIVIYPEIRSLFTLVSDLQTFQTFTISISAENMIGLLVSIKEVSVIFMTKISSQLLVYQQLEQRQLNIQGILQLYQTQIDRDSYIFVKEAYLETLPLYLLSLRDRSEVKRKVSDLIRNLQGKGLYLHTAPKVEDFVVCFDEVKVHNLEIFRFQQKESIEMTEAIKMLELQIEEYNN